MNEAEFKEKLTPEQFRVMREKGTEEAFTGKYTDFKGEGVFTCAACDNEIFDGSSKFDATNGWPNFYKPVSSEAVTVVEQAGGTSEVTCAECGSHLGYVYEDGPTDLGGKRYTINSIAMEMNEDEEEEDEEDEDEAQEKKKVQKKMVRQVLTLIAVAVAGAVLGAGYMRLSGNACKVQTSETIQGLDQGTKPEVINNTKTDAKSASLVATSQVTSLTDVKPLGISGGGVSEYAFNAITWDFAVGDPIIDTMGTVTPRSNVSFRLSQLTKNGVTISAAPAQLGTFDGSACSTLSPSTYEKGVVSMSQCGWAGGGEQLQIIRDSDVLKVRVRHITPNDTTSGVFADLTSVSIADLVK